MNKIIASICLLLFSAITTKSEGETMKFNYSIDSREKFESAVWDAKIENSAEGIRLVKTMMLHDELGMTDYKNSEDLSEMVRAKKEFPLDSGKAESCELIFFGTASKITFNGSGISGIRNIPSTGWSSAKIPIELLKEGKNEAVLFGSGNLVIENSLHPNRSAKSIDGGKTWDYDVLGSGNFSNGEYLVRLRLSRYSPEGKFYSDFIDLYSRLDSHIKPKITIRKLSVGIRTATPKQTSVEVLLRYGSTPSYNPNFWSGWKNYDSAVNEITSEKPGMRYVQISMKLKSLNPLETPIVKSLNISGEFDIYDDKFKDVKITAFDNKRIRRGFYQFSYQPPTERLSILRKKYNLDGVIKNGMTELEKFILLRNWVRHAWEKGWEMGDLNYCPPWDALLILELKKDNHSLGMCTHFSTVFVQCALALGYNARQVILDHHCVAEIWSNQFRKWFVIDTGNSVQDPELNCHFEKNGVPLNAQELHNVLKNNAASEIDVVYSGKRENIKGDKLPERQQCQLSNFIRFGIPLRNNFLETPFPGEPEHGFSNYFCDLYLWWQDNPVPDAYPEYSRQSCRKEDFYWDLNTTSIYADQGGKEDEIILTFNTVTPNFREYRVRTDEGAWEPVASSSFVWRLHKGTNKLAVKSVNQFGIEGIESGIEIIK